jgi:cytochrome c
MLITLVVTLVLCNFVYAMIKNSEVASGTVVFMLVFVLVLFNIIKDQAAFGNAIHEQTLEATKVAEKLEIEARNKTVQTSGINPQAIYDTKCIACHKFDVKVVGPPYDLTVPKYNGDVQKLAEYIFNPQKIDPNFPPMPNQGLKKKEATAMAQWLISKVGKK